MDGSTDRPWHDQNPQPRIDPLWTDQLIGRGTQAVRRYEVSKPSNRELLDRDPQAIKRYEVSSPQSQTPNPQTKKDDPNRSRLSKSRKTA